MSAPSSLKVIGCSIVFIVASLSWGNGDKPVSVTLGEVLKQYDLQGDFTAPVDPQTAWDVLTDYDHLSQFIHSMRGHIRSEKGEDFLVHQVATGGFLFFTASVEVLLNIHEDPIHSIVFKDVSGKDFESYTGSWTLQPVPAGVEVTYRLHAERNKQTPGFVSGKLLQSTTGDLLNEVRKEMERRKAIIQAAKDPPKKQ